MSEDTLRHSVYQSLNLKETEELLLIWQENKRYEWSDIAFDVLPQILEERGRALPPQEEAKIESGVESDETATEEDEGQPAFYNPEQLVSFASIASKAAWIFLFISVGFALWQFFGNLSDPTSYTPPWTLVAIFLTKLTTAGINFFMIKGVSIGLNVLMEFEYNSRGVK